MKCIHCENDCRFRERPDRRCPKCGHAFAFEPQKGDPITDSRMSKAIERVSSGGRVKFAVDHVYYELRRMRYWSPHKALLTVGCLSVFVPLPVFVLVAGLDELPNKGVLLTILLALIALPSVVVLFKASAQAMPRAIFDGLWNRYVAVHGLPSALLPKPRLPGKKFPEELLSYSFDRAVICDKPQTVELLIANHFHFENNCAVLGVDGYPSDAFEPVRAMLRNNPRLLVLALHDATPEGCRLAHRLRHDASWFKGIGKVVDVALRPGHARFFPGLSDFAANRLVSPTEGISQSEAEWLQHHELSLAVVRPEQIIKRLFRAMNHAEEGQSDYVVYGGGSSDSDGGDHEGGSSDWTIFGSDADASDGGGDSFG